LNVKDFPIIIITGLSGSGKSTAIAAFEDAGFYCVDNMPVALLPKFLELTAGSAADIGGVAFVMDLREKAFLPQYKGVFDALRQQGYRFEILFLEADDPILIQRYSQTRRHHPLAQEKTLPDSIREERAQLEDLRKASDRILNTSTLNVHELKATIIDIAHKRIKTQSMTISILSFGFKYGIPHDADLIADVRFIANPYFVPELKALDGEAEPVRQYVLEREETRVFLRKYIDLLDYLIPLYEKEGKAYLTIAVGCTGGRHRSVAVVDYLFKLLNKSGRRVQKNHRDIQL
jgi:UPF0042 nucleotide-binding protein